MWSALTEPDRIGRWIAPVTGDLEVGGRYQLENHAGGTILACEPPSRLRVTWEYAGHVGWVDVTLTPPTTAAPCSLLEHSAPSAEDHWAEFGPGAVGIGWEAMLMGSPRTWRPRAPRRPAPTSCRDLRRLLRGVRDRLGRGRRGGGRGPRLGPRIRGALCRGVHGG